MTAAALVLAAAALEGVWTGRLVNLPARPDAPVIEVTREVGPMPAREGECATFRTTYREAGVVKGVKDYRLCRGADPDQADTDEGGGLVLRGRWLGDVLVTPFKVGNILLVTTLRLDGDRMVEEIVTADDQPAGEGVVTMRPRSIQRLELTRRAQAR